MPEGEAPPRAVAGQPIPLEFPFHRATEHATYLPDVEYAGVRPSAK
jgi:hypothetical protein